MKLRLIILILLLCTAFTIRAEQCTWIDDPQAQKLYSAISDLGESLQDWDTHCKADKPTREYMKQCWCEVNKARLTELKAKLDDASKRYPQWMGKKVCYKTDEVTSVNLFLSSYDTFVKRCE